MNGPIRHRRQLPAWMPGALLLSYGFAALVYLVHISWNQPVLDMFGFRQAQTAISAYWMAKGGPLLAYETPVVGFPWSIPFEFPIYQWLTALVASPGLISVDQAGRLVSVAFFLAGAAVVYRLVLRLWADRALALAVAGAFLASPMALFWARAVLMESTVVFFSLAFLYALLEFHHGRQTRHVVAAVLLATAAALVKVTTFYGFVVPLAIVLLVMLAKSVRTASFQRNLRTCLVAGGAVFVAMAVLVAWLGYADALKTQTPLGGVLSSGNIQAFTYGTLQQRLDLTSWGTITFGRALVDVLGSGWILLAGALVLAFHASLRWVALLLLVAYLVPFLTFTNLHYQHDYYQFANFAFLSTLVGLAIGSLARRGNAGVVAATAAAAVVIAASTLVLMSKFVPAIHVNQSQGRVIDIARFLRGHTQENQSVLFFGIDWSSELPYYATRRSVAVPDWIPSEYMRLLLDPDRAFGPHPLGALVVCPNGLSAPNSDRLPIYQAILGKYSQGLTSRRIRGCEVFTRAP